MNETQLLLMTLGVMFIIYVAVMVISRFGKCPNCNGQMHRMIDSNVWMCENPACRYSEIRRGGHG